MRKWYLISVPLMCVLLCVSIIACSGGQASEDASGGEGNGDTTTSIDRTTTTLAPASWESVAPSGDQPVPRLGASLSYVENGEILLLFGGWDGGTDYLADLWSYDLASDTWTRLESTGDAPAPRAAHAAAYDPGGGRLVVFGGYDGLQYHGDTWIYDVVRKAWTTPTSTTVSPRARYGHSLTYDPVSKTMILFGGYDGDKQYGDTWAYDLATNTWTDLKPSGATPAARDSHAAAYDPEQQVVVLFGGWSTTRLFNDTWAYDPTEDSWTVLELLGEPPAARALPQMAYDSTIKKFVVFGGGTSTATFDDAWLLDIAQSEWVPAAADGDPPSARAGHAMSYDPSNRRVLLFGGSNGTGDFFNDMWSLRR